MNLADRGERSKMTETGVVLAALGVPPLDWVEQNRELWERMEEQEQKISRELKNWPRSLENDAFSCESQKLAERVKERGGYDILEVGYDQFAAPSVAEAIEKVIAKGAHRVIVVPTMFTRGGVHVETDIPQTVTALQKQYPEVEIMYAGPPFDPNKHADLIISKIREHDEAHVPSEAELGLMRLSALETGETGLVYDMVAGHSLVSRLSALGFTPDAQVTMVQNFGHGPVIVSIRDTRIALGRGEAGKVRVRRSSDEQ